MLENKFTFGKYNGQPVRNIAETDPCYIFWVHKNVTFFKITEEEMDMARNAVKKAFKKTTWLTSCAMDDVFGGSANIFW